MTYPHAILIAAALVVGGILLSDRTDAAFHTGASVAVSSSEKLKSTAWVARSDGSTRFCAGSLDGVKAACSSWIAP
jgi:hypothetical protein